MPPYGAENRFAPPASLQRLTECPQLFQQTRPVAGFEGLARTYQAVFQTATLAAHFQDQAGAQQQRVTMRAAVATLEHIGQRRCIDSSITAGQVFRLAARYAVVARITALLDERKRLERGSTTILDVARLEENLTDAELQLLRAQTTREAAGEAGRAWSTCCKPPRERMPPVC